jgi:hypothetical protein
LSGSILLCHKDKSSIIRESKGSMTYGVSHVK